MQDQPVESKTIRKPVLLIWRGLGLFFVAIGCAGVVLPVLPTTPFMLMALWAFAKGSPALHAWPAITGLDAAWRHSRAGKNCGCKCDADQPRGDGLFRSGRTGCARSCYCADVDRRSFHSDPAIRPSY